MAELLDRLLSYVDASGDCWLWTGLLDRSGYGLATVQRRHRPAHRALYELLVGPVDPVLTMDHLCRNPPCVNPDHLEPVTRGENVRRGMAGRLKHHCKRGHPLSGRNLLIQSSGRRWCRTCRAAFDRASYQRRRLAAA